MKNLRYLRKNQNLTMKELGKIIGVAESTISLYETGKREPDIKTLSKLASFFSVSTDYILGITDDPSPTPTVDYAVAEVKKKLKAEGIDMEDLNDEDIIEMLAKIVKMKKK